MDTIYWLTASVGLAKKRNEYKLFPFGFCIFFLLYDFLVIAYNFIPYVLTPIVFMIQRFLKVASYCMFTSE